VEGRLEGAVEEVRVWKSKLDETEAVAEGESRRVDSRGYINMLIGVITIGKICFAFDLYSFNNKTCYDPVGVST
jgi:hypothetical protein